MPSPGSWIGGGRDARGYHLSRRQRTRIASFDVLDTAKLHVTFREGARTDGPLGPRRYTLTHSDRTGDLFLSVGADYDRQALHALQVRLERDEVLGEWIASDAGPSLILHMAAQGGLPLFGTARMRRDIFRRYRALVLAALEYGDRALTDAHPEIAGAPVVACFHWRDEREEREPWGEWGPPSTGR
jgi:hypothetical protein